MKAREKSEKSRSSTFRLLLLPQIGYKYGAVAHDTPAKQKNLLVFYYGAFAITNEYNKTGVSGQDFR